MTIHCSPAQFYGRCLVSALILITALQPTSSHATESSEPIICGRSGHATVTPALTMAAADFQFDELGVVGPCPGPDGSQLRGTIKVERADTSAHGSCSGARFTAKSFTITWEDGSTSTGGDAAGQIVPPYVTGSGRILEGRFAGRSYRNDLLVAPQSPQACFSAGVTDVDYYGLLVLD